LEKSRCQESRHNQSRDLEMKEN